MRVKRLQAYATGSNGHWEAICVDLDIAVQGASFDEVKSLLDGAVAAYVEAASQEDDVTARRLLNRRAPLWLRINLAMSYLLHLLTRNRDDGHYKAGYDIPCHA